MKTTNEMQKYIYDQEEKWFSKFQPFLKGKVLKVGNGLGYFGSFIAKTNPDLTIIDVHKNERAENDNNVVIYDGQHFPFEDKSFDSVVCTYVLHHTSYPLEVFNEMRRVAKRIIIIEETHSNIFAKLDLIYRDIYVNVLAGQPSKIHWKSYFKKGDLEKLFTKNNLTVINHQEERKRTYWKELFVLE